MADEDPKHLARLRGMSCCKCGRHPPNDPHHHTGRRGMGQRAHDHDAMPLCGACHRGLHDLSGPFKGWNREQLQRWQDDQVTLLQPTPDVF